MKYFIEWHSKKYHHNYTAPITAESIEEAKEKFFKIYRDDATIINILASVNNVQVDNIGPQKGYSEGVER